MNESPPSDPDDFQKELEILRSILQKNLQHTKENPLLGTQLEFWLESARFLELDIKIWDQAGNEYQESRARERIRKVLDTLQELVNRMNEERGDGKSNP